MEILFTYRSKQRQWGLSNKVLKLKLPDADLGVLAFKFDEGRYLEIAQLFRGEATVSGEIRDDYEALTEALYEFEEDGERLQSEAAIIDFEVGLKEFAAENPNPLDVAVFANKLAADLGIEIGDVAKQRAGEQLDLLKAAE